MLYEKIVSMLREAGIGLFTTLPCEKMRGLYDMISQNFEHISLAREEEGVGICAGAYLAGRKPAMVVQSSGMGNMLGALCSLTKVYEFPLPILISWRGVYKEKIPAQVPLGKNLPRLLDAVDIRYTIIQKEGEIPSIMDAVLRAYEENAIHAVLLSPKLWERKTWEERERVKSERRKISQHLSRAISQPELTRFEILKALSPYLDGKIVVCNLGIPSKELYRVKHQKSNFYMLGSMGLASSIALGISLFTQKEVIAIEGDGSLLMNPGALSTIAVCNQKNLTIVAIDNGVHGSTGNQLTATSYCADLEVVARGFGLENTFKAASKQEICSTLENLGMGPNFVHLLARAGNADVPDIPLSPARIKQNVMEALRE